MPRQISHFVFASYRSTIAETAISFSYSSSFYRLHTLTEYIRQPSCLWPRRFNSPAHLVVDSGHGVVHFLLVFGRQLRRTEVNGQLFDCSGERERTIVVEVHRR